MISPSPTQPPPVQPPPDSGEEQPAPSRIQKRQRLAARTSKNRMNLPTKLPHRLRVGEEQTESIRVRPGQRRAARITKSIFRPIIKFLYYLITSIRTHKLVTLLVILLLLASITTTTFFTTGALPFGIGEDQFHFQVNGNSNTSKIGGHVENWIYALREGNTTTMSLIQAELTMSQPPDVNQLVSTYSQTKAHLRWKAINTLGVYTQADSSVDVFIGIDIAGDGPSGTNAGTIIFHFVTIPAQNGRILFIEQVSARPSLA